MAISIIREVAIEAIGACIPKTVIKNAEFGRELYGEKLDSLINSTGMIERHVCGSDKLTSLDLSVRAAETLFQSTGILREEIGAIVFVTLTPDAIMPNNASLAHHLLGLPECVPCFDINHACSGYIYGLWVSSLIAKSMQKRVLLLDADTNSYYVSPKDKATAILFGDAGTATILSPQNGAFPWSFDFQTDGSGRSYIQMPGFGFRELLDKKSLEYLNFPDGSSRRRIDMEMDGASVFNYVVNKASKLIAAFLDDLETSAADYSYAVFHQANAFMLRQLARKLGFKPEQVPMSMGKYGNTSSASIPLTICSEIGSALSSTSPKHILMSGFGAGLAYGAVDLEIGNLKSIGVIEYEC